MRDALRGVPVRDLLFDERGDLRPLVNVYLDKTQVDDLDVAVSDDGEIRVVAAIAGGADLRSSPLACAAWTAG